MEQPSTRVFYHECYVILADGVSSVLDKKRTAYLNAVICDDEAFMRFVLLKHTPFFAKAASAYQKCIYVHSPPAEFWGIPEQDRYGHMIAQLSALAKQSRFLAMDSTPLRSFFGECRGLVALRHEQGS